MKEDKTMNQANVWMDGWMGGLPAGGMWLWWLGGILISLLMIIVMIRLSNR